MLRGSVRTTWSIVDSTIIEVILIMAPMNYLLLWILGFGTLWAGLKLFDDEVLLIVSMMVGSVLVLSGLITSPPALRTVIEVALVVALFFVCTECIMRGDQS